MTEPYPWPAHDLRRGAGLIWLCSPTSRRDAHHSTIARVSVRRVLRRKPP